MKYNISIISLLYIFSCNLSANSNTDYKGIDNKLGQGN